MTALSANDFSVQMIQQLRLFSNSASAEVGTPERAIIDTLAQALSLTQIDLTGLTGALDVDSKFGSNLDSFVGLFGFSRVSGTVASGFVVFSTNAANTVDVQIPAGTTIIATVSDSQGVLAQYTTIAAGVLSQGKTSTTPIPVAAVNIGSSGNAAAGVLQTISTTGGSLLQGVTSVTNPNPITGGSDQEDDNSLKVRFKNTLFRNLAGTPDQYLALAISTAFSTKANIIGPISTYQEYIQVPQYDDTNTGAPGGWPFGGGTQARQYTTAVSTIPYAQAVYSSNPVFVTTAPVGASTFFFRNGIDYIFNYPSLNVGDAFRNNQLNGALTPFQVQQPNFTFTNVYTGLLTNIDAVIPGQVLLIEYSYMSAESRNTLVNNVTNAVDVYVDGENPVTAYASFNPPATAAPGTTYAVSDQPNDTFYLENYRRDGLPTKRPVAGNVITPLFYSPMLSIPNTIYIGGQNYYIGVHYWLVHETDNLRGSLRARDGIEWSMIVPGQTTVDSPPPVTYDGSLVVSGDPTATYTPQGNLITQWATGNPNLSTGPSPITTNYTYDQNIIDLQAALEGSKQITTDVLAHKATAKHYKLDISVMYSPGATPTTVNSNIQTALQTFFQGQYFGSVIQLSDLLQVVHSVSGVDNVRWSADVPTSVGNQNAALQASPPIVTKVFETDINGNSLVGATVDRARVGSSALGFSEWHNLYVTGQPINGSFILTWKINGNTYTTSAIALNTLTATILGNAVTTALSSLIGALTVTVNQINTSTTGVNNISQTYQIVYPSILDTLNLPIVSYAFGLPITLSQYLNNYDFFLRDNQLPVLAEGSPWYDSLTADPSVNPLAQPLPGVYALPGLIIRARAQNTWISPLL